MDYCMNCGRFCLAWNTHVNPFLLFNLLAPKQNPKERIFQGLSHGLGLRYVFFFFPTPQSIIHSFCLFPILIHIFAPHPSFLSSQPIYFHHIMIMKSSHILLFCVLATASYVFYQHFSIASPLNFLPGKSEYQNIQGGDEEIKRSTTQEDFIAEEQRSSSENLEENVYHIDYHGVMTHPTPTPKHPQP